MLALMGSECSSFHRGRQQMEWLAGLQVTAKAVERVTEAIGADIARRQQETVQQAMQLELPVAVGQAIPKIYVQRDGTGLPMKDREVGGPVAGTVAGKPRIGGSDSDGGRLLRTQCRSHALSQIPQARTVCRLRCNRSRMQNRDGFAPQTLGYVLDRSRSQRRHCTPMLPP